MSWTSFFLKTLITFTEQGHQEQQLLLPPVAHYPMDQHFAGLAFYCNNFQSCMYLIRDTMSTKGQFLWGKADWYP